MRGLRRKNEILGLTWDEIDEAGGVIRLSPARSKTLVGRILPISPPIADALDRRRAHTPHAAVNRPCCMNRHWPARCQPTGFSPADTIRHWAAGCSQRIGNSRRTGARAGVSGAAAR